MDIIISNGNPVFMTRYYEMKLQLKISGNIFIIILEIGRKTNLISRDSFVRGCLKRGSISFYFQHFFTPCPLKGVQVSIFILTATIFRQFFKPPLGGLGVKNYLLKVCFGMGCPSVYSRHLPKRGDNTRFFRSDICFKKITKIWHLI